MTGKYLMQSINSTWKVFKQSYLLIIPRIRTRAQQSINKHVQYSNDNTSYSYRTTQTSVICLIR